MLENGRLRERLRHRLIGSPLEPPARAARRAWSWLGTLRHPEFRTVALREPAAIDALLPSVVADGTHCVDAGAHLGSVTAALLRLSPRGRHLAVEPTPYKAAWLRAKFPAVEVAECALGAEGGRAPFFHQPAASGYSGLRAARLGVAPEAFAVDVRRLDDLVPIERRVGFVKLDVEGGELGALRGAPRILARDRPVLLLECTLTGLDAFGQTPGELHDFLAARGYALYTPPDRLAGLPPLGAAELDRAVRYPYRAFNFLAIPLAK